MISQSLLKDRFTYNPKTGRFFWKSHRLKIFIGQEAGSSQKGADGVRRWRLTFGGHKIARARAAYIFMRGDIPEGALVDHKNGKTLDDRIHNLRLASNVQNTWNTIRSATPGVHKGPRGKFKSRIQLPDGTRVNLGTWDTKAEAAACYMGASAILHGDFSTRKRRIRSR
jgi:hypothetical protein